MENELNNKITINGNEYNAENLSEVVINNIASLKFVEAEIQRLQAQLAVYQTAKLGYARAIQEGLPTIPDSDTIQFS